MVVTNRQERIADINISGANTTLVLPTNGGLIPNDRWLHSLILQVELRMTNPHTGFPTGVLADAPFSLIDTVTVSGFHKVRGTNEEFIKVRGADLREMDRLYKGVSPYMTPTTALNLTADATNDIRFQLQVPFVPLGLSDLAQESAWLLDAPNYDRLTLTIQWADALSVFSGQSTQPTFSAYGSATGTPRIRVEGLFAMGGAAQFRGLVPGRVWRYGLETSSGDIVSGATGARLFNLPRGYKLRSLLMKVGTKAAVTGSNNAYSSLTQTAFQNIVLNRGLNRAIRRYSDQFTILNNNLSQYKILPTAGYSMLDFCSSGHPAEVLDTSSWVSGATGDVDFYLSADVTGAASQACALLLEEWRGTLVNNRPR